MMTPNLHSQLKVEHFVTNYFSSNIHVYLLICKSQIMATLKRNILLNCSVWAWLKALPNISNLQRLVWSSLFCILFFYQPFAFIAMPILLFIPIGFVIWSDLKKKKKKKKKKKEWWWLTLSDEMRMTSGHLGNSLSLNWFQCFYVYQSIDAFYYYYFFYFLL